MGHTSDAGPRPDWSWLKSESINQLAITQPKSLSSERLHRTKIFKFASTFISKSPSNWYVFIHALWWWQQCQWVAKCRLFFQTFFPKLNISKVRFSLHSTNDTCDIQIGIPIYQKLISESVVWNSRSPRCLITVLISSPQHQQPPPRVLDYWAVGFRATPTAVGSLLLLAHGSPVLLWLRCCCLLLNITAAGSMAGPGWCRVHYQLPDSAAQHTLLALTLVYTRTCWMLGHGLAD